jgi:hypothetical protein
MPIYELDEADQEREDQIADLRARLTWAWRLLAVAALAGVLGGAALAPYVAAVLP